MKKFNLLFIVLVSFLYSCRAQELYIIIDTRDTVNVKCEIFHYDNDKYVDNITVDYYIPKDDPDMDYGGGVLLRYIPYNDSITNKWKFLHNPRTKNVSRCEWMKLKKQSEVKVVNGLDWVNTTPWDSIYKELQRYFYKGNTYIIDKQFASKDSIQIREVEYMDIRAQE